MLKLQEFTAWGRISLWYKRQGSRVIIHLPFALFPPVFSFFLEIRARDFYKNQLQQGSILLTGNMLCSQDNMQQLYKEYNAADSNMSHSWCFRDPTDRKRFFLFLFG